MIWLLPAAVFLIIVVLCFWRQLDRRLERAAWQSLRALSSRTADVFDQECIKPLPEAAQRYFLYSIRPGTPLKRSVELELSGQIGMGGPYSPSYRPMEARQILAPPFGLVWSFRCGVLAGSDGLTPTFSWSRFWLLGCLPVVRAGRNEDHRRSAFGRVIAEAAFWVPASLLPGPSVRWEEVDDNTARAVVSFSGLEQSVDITVAEDGQPTRVVIQRWSNENPDKTFREQPFGGYPTRFMEFGGYRLATVVEGGNHIGTDAYFPFYKARVERVRFPDHTR